MERELESSVALCENVLQKIQKADEEREQLEMQLQSKTEEVTKLNEEVRNLNEEVTMLNEEVTKLNEELKQAGECTCIFVLYMCLIG